MGTTPTVIPIISPPQFAARLAALFPGGWAGSDAAQGGLLYAFLLSLSQGLTAVLGQVQYALNAVYVPTETAPELDYASEDFYGNTLPRPPGMTDADYARLILSGLFQSAATRSAISNALKNLTGVTPRMIEPWAPGDTGAWDTVGVSYWDVDNVVSPFLWTGEERFTGFIITPAPPSSFNTGGNPILCWDDGWFWDIPGSAFFDLVINALSSVFSVINRLRAWGITVGVKIVATPG